MKRAALLAVVVLGLLAPPAGGTTITGEDLTRPYQAWANAAKVPTPTRTVTVTENALGCRGCVSAELTPRDGTVIWFDPSSSRSSFLHELGHVYALDHPELASFWDERFADSYSLCATGSRFWQRSGRRVLAQSGYGHSYRLGELRHICADIRLAGRWTPTVTVTVLNAALVS